MQYQVLVQHPSEHHYVASVIGLSGIMAEGETEEEVITRVRNALSSQLATAKLITIEVDSGTSLLQQSKPDMKHAGILADDPMFEDWMEKMALIRQQANEIDEE